MGARAIQKSDVRLQFFDSFLNNFFLIVEETVGFALVSPEFSIL